MSDDEERPATLEDLEKYLGKVSDKIKSECNDLNIDIALWLMHFNHIEPYLATCEDCADNHKDICPNPINNPIKCFKGKKSLDMVKFGGW